MLLFTHAVCLLSFVQAEGDARLAHKLASTWPKPLHRLAQALQVACFTVWYTEIPHPEDVPCGEGPIPTHRRALLDLQGQQRWEEAIAACQEGMACCGAIRDFEPLRNTLAVQAALRGCYAGFPGRLLDVCLLLWFHLVSDPIV